MSLELKKSAYTYCDGVVNNKITMNHANFVEKVVIYRTQCWNWLYRQIVEQEDTQCLGNSNNSYMLQAFHVNT